jgi:hypothetical protein
MPEFLRGDEREYERTDADQDDATRPGRVPWGFRSEAWQIRHGFISDEHSQPTV